MTDGFARLLAPILPVTAEQLWRICRATARRVGAPRAVPVAAEIDALIDASCSTHGNVCCGSGRRSTRSLELLRKDKQIGTSLEAKVRSPPQVRTSLCCSVTRSSCPCCSSCPRSSSSAAARRRMKDRRGIAVSRATGVKCERCWRYVSAVSDRSGPGRYLRSLSGRAGGSRHFLMTSIRRRMPEIWIAAAIVVARPGDQSDGEVAAAAARERDGHSGFLRSDARAEHRRGVRHAQRHRVRIQAGRHGHRRAGRRSAPSPATR